VAEPAAVESRAAGTYSRRQNMITLKLKDGTASVRLSLHLALRFVTELVAKA
jgi:hypothetical protein